LLISDEVMKRIFLLLLIHRIRVRIDEERRGRKHTKQESGLHVGRCGRNIIGEKNGSCSRSRNDSDALWMAASRWAVQCFGVMRQQTTPGCR